MIFIKNKNKLLKSQKIKKIYSLHNLILGYANELKLVFIIKTR